MPRENLKTTRWHPQETSSPSTLWTSVPFLERCISNSPPEISSRGGPIPPSIPGPRPTSPGCSSRNSERYPLSSAGQEVLEGANSMGSLRRPVRNTVLSSSSFLQDLPHPRNGGTVQPDLPGGFSLHYEKEVDLATMRFHLKRWTEEVYNRGKPP